MSIDRWTKCSKICNGILFSFKEEGNSDTYNMDENWKHYAKWNKPDTKEQISYDSTYMRLPRVLKIIKTESKNDGSQGLEEGVRGYCLKDTEFHLEMIKKFWKLIMVVVVWHCDCTLCQ